MSKRGQARRCVLVRLSVVVASTMAIGALCVTPLIAQAPPPGPSASSDERARSLDALFKGLKSARGDDEADELVARIWEIWTHSGRADVDKLMDTGASFLSVRQLGVAHELFTEVIEAAPQFAEAWNKRATVRFLLFDYEGSLADIEKTLALEPRHFGALAGRGIIHAQSGRWKEALDAYQQALSVNPFLKERQTIIPELERRAGEKPL